MTHSLSFVEKAWGSISILITIGRLFHCSMVRGIKEAWPIPVVKCLASRIPPVRAVLVFAMHGVEMASCMYFGSPVCLVL